MPEARLPAASFDVTLLVRDDCPTCVGLIDRLMDFVGELRIDLRTVNLNTAEPPPYAQGVIVPATYIGERLWRYGAYAVQELADRLAAGRSPGDPRGSSSS